MHKEIITKARLESYRVLGDEPADVVIELLVAENGIGCLRQLMPFLSDYQSDSFDNQPQLLQNFLLEHSSFPLFFDKKQLIRSTDFYRANQQSIGLILGLYSLPYCYLGADGARVLYLSERIRNDTYKRLLETGSFLRAVMNYDNWQSGKIFGICVKVRLLHAAIRYFTLQSNRWDMAWGYPINQEDMLGTNLAFSLVVLRGMRKLGYSVDDSYERAYLNVWSVIGFLLGVKAELMPETYLAAVKTDKLIAERQFRQSIEGKELTDSLVRTVRGLSPNKLTADLLQEQARFLLGEKYAEMLGISETNIPHTLLKVYNSTSVLLSKIF